MSISERQRRLKGQGKIQHGGIPHGIKDGTLPSGADGAWVVLGSPHYSVKK